MASPGDQGERDGTAIHAPGSLSVEGAPAERLLDARGLKCPLPVLRARKAMKGMASGAVLTVIADDPAAPADFRAFCAQTGALLLELAEEDGGTARLRIAAP